MARDVGETRIPVTGERAGADFGRRSPFRYQLKVRRSLPAWLFTWLDGIRAAAARADTSVTGVLVLNRPRRDRKDALVVLRWADWVALHGSTEPGEQSESNQPGG